MQAVALDTSIFAYFFTNAIFNQLFSYFKGNPTLKFYLMEHGFVVQKRICACPSLFLRILVPDIDAIICAIFCVGEEFCQI